MQRRQFLNTSAGAGLGLILASSGLLLGACTTTGTNSPTDKVSRRRELDAGVTGALDKLYATVPGSRELGTRASGILVFPAAISGGFIVGAEAGDGALRVGNATRGYYRTVSGSFGWQIGGQSRALILMFMTPDSLNKFVKSEGWTAGVDATVAIAKIGANGQLDTNTAQQPIVGFSLTNAGLMAGATVEGTKITRLDL